MSEFGFWSGFILGAVAMGVYVGIIIAIDAFMTVGVGDETETGE